MSRRTQGQRRNVAWKLTGQPVNSGQLDRIRTASLTGKRHEMWSPHASGAIRSYGAGQEVTPPASGRPSSNLTSAGDDSLTSNVPPMGRRSLARSLKQGNPCS